MQIAGAEQIITERMDVNNGGKDTGREEPKGGEGRSREGEDRRKEGGKSGNNIMRKGFSEDVLKEEQALGR